MAGLSEVDGLFVSFLTLSICGLIGLIWMRIRKGQDFQYCGRVNALYSYPVKSCSGRKVQRAECTQLGLKDDGITDRTWMVISESNELISLLTTPRLMLITVRSEKDKLLMNTPGMPELSLPKQMDSTKLNVISCKLFGDRMDAADCGVEAANWISAFLQKEGCRIVFAAPELKKRESCEIVKPWKNRTQKGDLIAFGKQASYLVASTSSLENLNQKLDKPISIVNFRPGIVIEGTPAFDEDHWKEIRIGEKATLRCVQPCRRCPVTTIDPVTGEMDSEKQPLPTLKSFRCYPPYGSSPLFGVYGALDTPGIINVGDPVYILRE